MHVHSQKFDGLLGFSQGAMVSAALSAIKESQHPSSHLLESLRFVLLFSGRLPRAHDLEPFFQKTIQTPSLHVWGNSDEVIRPSHSMSLADKFSLETRHEFQHHGGHVIPNDIDARTRIIAFLQTIYDAVPCTNKEVSNELLEKKPHASL